jgi:hypothetical protein
MHACIANIKISSVVDVHFFSFIGHRAFFLKIGSHEIHLVSKNSIRNSLRLSVNALEHFVFAKIGSKSM